MCAFQKSRSSRDSGSSRPQGRPGSRSDGAPSRAPRSRPPLDPEKALARQPWSLLQPFLGPADRAGAQLAGLRRYAGLLFEWNRGVSNLISRHDEPRLVERHLFESLAPARLLIESGCKKFVDFGSGAGLPAVPLAICGVGEAWTLVESRRNKTLFIRKAQQEIGLTQVSVITGRLEVLADEGLAELACDGFTSRATAAVGPTLALAAKIVAPGGTAFLWKGSSYVDEMAASESEWAAHWSFVQAPLIGDGPNVCAVFKRK